MAEKLQREKFDEYTKQLEEVIKRMLQPLDGVPFRLVINSLSATNVIQIDANSDADKELIAALSVVAHNAGSEINKLGIIRGRPNEVGNDIEQFVKAALIQTGFSADVPAARSGKKKSTGYPDLEFKDKHHRTIYIECKSYNIENIATTQRSFYLSPSDDFKVTKDALHIGISYEVFVAGQSQGGNVYKVKHWKIVDLGKLAVDVKYEFNSDNKRLYAKANILAQADC